PLGPRPLPSFPPRRSSDLDGGYEPFVYKTSLRYDDVEIAEDVYLIVRERAEEYVYKKSQPTGSTEGATGGGVGQPVGAGPTPIGDRKSTRLNSSHVKSSYA